MPKFIDKILNVMNLNDYDDDDIFDDEDDVEPSPAKAAYTAPEKRQFKSYSGGKAFEATAPKVVNLQASVQMEVVVIQPASYDEAQTICDHIKSKRPVILNLENLDKPIAQRIMDFVSGSCYTLNGNIQRITHNIFIIAPENTDIVGDFREELKSSGIILPWKSE